MLRSLWHPNDHAVDNRPKLIDFVSRCEQPVHRSLSSNLGGPYPPAVLLVASSFHALPV